MSVLVNPYAFASAGGGGGIPDPPYLQVASGEVGADLTSYPVYVDLSTMPAGFWSSVDADGGNLRIRSGSTLLPLDIVAIDTGAETGHLFFRADLAAASDNYFSIDFDGGALAAVTDPDGRNAVWSAFDWVFMGDTAYTDRTGGTAGSLTTGSVSSFPIAMGGGGGLDFTSALITFSSRTSRSVFTLGGTCRLDVAPLSANNVFHTYGQNISSRCGLNARNNGSTDSWNMWDNANSWIAGDSGGALVQDASKRLHGVYNGTTARILYGDGSVLVTDLTITARGSDTAYFIGGTPSSGSEYLNGKCAYLYQRPEVLSPEYIAAEYSNLNAPGSFYSITWA